MRGPETVKFPSRAKIANLTRKIKRIWQSKEEKRIADEYDVVMVPFDGDSLSGSECDGGDWSIGWLEPHAPGFQSAEDADDGFAVLVPCYRHDRKELKTNANNQILNAIKNLPNGVSAEVKKYMEERLSSPQNC